MNTLKCFKTGTARTINFPFETTGKFMNLGVPVLKYSRGDYMPTCNLKVLQIDSQNITTLESFKELISFF